MGRCKKCGEEREFDKLALIPGVMVSSYPIVPGVTPLPQKDGPQSDFPLFRGKDEK